MAVIHLRQKPNLPCHLRQTVSFPTKIVSSPTNRVISDKIRVTSDKNGSCHLRQNRVISDKSCHLRQIVSSPTNLAVSSPTKYFFLENLFFCKFFFSKIFFFRKFFFWKIFFFENFFFLKIFFLKNFFFRKFFFFETFFFRKFFFSKLFFFWKFFFSKFFFSSVDFFEKKKFRKNKLPSYLNVLYTDRNFDIKGGTHGIWGYWKWGEINKYSKMNKYLEKFTNLKIRKNSEKKNRKRCRGVNNFCLQVATMQCHT